MKQAEREDGNSSAPMRCPACPAKKLDAIAGGRTRWWRPPCSESGGRLSRPGANRRQQRFDRAQVARRGGEMRLRKVAHACVTRDGEDASLDHHRVAFIGVIAAQVGCQGWQRQLLGAAEGTLPGFAHAAAPRARWCGGR